ncbi:hypothetical protein KUTeg_003788 [Tegillarca granosa]|uniref:RING-type domain-containing protein n=1 Tax=Tegillarca granosa TaxID=220873 RepID=A0ABQ9FN47_TEGGR|nr:hypothetical protein KUTeg_003788 [Tegillarca granosa]
MYCDICITAQVCNSFTTGCDVLKKESVKLAVNQNCRIMILFSESQQLQKKTITYLVMLEESLGKMIDISPVHFITALIMLTSLVFLGLALNLRTGLYQVFIRFLPLGWIKRFIAKFNEVAMVTLRSITTYNAGWPSFLLVVPTIMKWSCYCLGLSQVRGKQIQVQQGQVLQDDGGNQEDEIDLDYEKQMSYVKAAFQKYQNLTNDELCHALKYLKSQGLFGKRNVVDLCHAINNIKVNGQVQRQVTCTSFDNEPTFQQNSHTRQELVEILVASNKYDRRDVEDVMNRYHEQHGQMPTMEQFVEFHGSLKGIADLEAKLDTEKRKLDRKDRTIEDKDRTVEDNQRTIEDNQRTIEDNHRTIEDKDRTIEDKDRTIEDKDRTIEDNQRTIEDKNREIGRLEKRLICKICMDNEMSIVCLPCGHLYCCSSDVCRNNLTTRGKCHICNQVVTGQIQTHLA